MSRTILALLLTLLCSSMCLAQGDTDALKHITDPDDAHMLFSSALKEKNVEQLCALYADDAVMVLKDGTMEVQGKYRIRRVFEWMTDSVESLTLEKVYKVESEDTVLFRSKYRSVFTTDDGEKVDRMCSGIEVLKRQPDGNWLFIIHHQDGGANVLN